MSKKSTTGLFQAQPFLSLEGMFVALYDLMRFYGSFLALFFSLQVFALEQNCQQFLAVSPFEGMSSLEIENLIAEQARGGLLSPQIEIDKKITEVDAWTFSEEEEQAFQEIMYDLSESSVNRRIRNLYHALIKARLSKLNSVSSFFARKAVKDALEQKSIYSRTLGRALHWLVGPHYNPLFNRVALRGVPQQESSLGIESIIALNEVEKAIDRNTSPFTYLFGTVTKVHEFFMSFFRTPLSPYVARRFESRAISAQWELVSRIPPEQRALLQMVLETGLGPLSAEKELILDYIVKSNLIVELKKMYSKTYEAGGTSVDDVPMFHVVDMLLDGKKLLEDRLFQKGLSQIPSDEKLIIEDILKNGLESVHVKQLMATTTFDESNDMGWTSNLVTDVFRSKIRRHNETDFEKSFKEVFIVSLENADLSKQEFFEAVAYVHGAALDQLIHKHYKPDAWKIVLFYLGMQEILVNVFSGQDPNPAFILANDIRWIWQLSSYLYGF